MAKPHPLSKLEDALGYRFNDAALLERALTHSSARGANLKPRDNERLEFIGDRVLGLAIAELLGERFPEAREGELAKKFNQLVRRETCALVARRLNLGDHLILSGSEDGSGGRTKDTILADAMEALLAAVFIDGGFAAARGLIRRLWDATNLALSDRVQDAKSALQEWVQGQGLALPRYNEIGRTGPDHAPEFISEVSIEGHEPARGKGPSKRIAEQSAAAAVLIRQGVWEDDPHGG
ncbi:MAG: ribonuclease III [Alphaproteobacteria bacterium]|nr:ribonuclease III [Alphaproteobacteria bacterium]